MGLRLLERSHRVGIGKGGEKFLIGELRKPRKSPSSAFTDRIGEGGVMIGEEQEGTRARVFLTHEYQRNLRTYELESDGCFERARISKRGQPLAEGAVADLVMILKKQNKRRWW